jgi:hypothetical protein
MTVTSSITAHGRSETFTSTRSVVHAVAEWSGVSGHDVPFVPVVLEHAATRINAFLSLNVLQVHSFIQSGAAMSVFLSRIGDQPRFSTPVSSRVFFLFPSIPPPIDASDSPFISTVPTTLRLLKAALGPFSVWSSSTPNATACAPAAGTPNGSSTIAISGVSVAVATHLLEVPQNKTG